jgi:asparagine synthase (glutamine-hydrolysing)
MCGITGFLTQRGTDRFANQSLLEQMTDSLRHRGPDARGTWQSQDGHVNLGHRRLSILDLTPTGAQPMASQDGRYIVTFNGEIYNFREIRTELEKMGRRFVGASDTEVLLMAVVEWGIEAALRLFNGMFAFALWDKVNRELYLARDRFGEKPIYYTWQNGDFVFGSELKALVVHPSFRREVDPDSVALFLRFSYVPWPKSIYRDTYKLGPAQFMRVKLGSEPPVPRAYWALHQVIEQQPLLSIDPADPALADMLDAALRKAVASRMVSDVPLGAFLSGGIDSSLVVAMMQHQSARPVKTFTIGFWEAPFNEAENAAGVARYLGTEHHEHYLSSRECIEVIQGLPETYDEPFADSSQIPTLLVSAFTRRHVTVALSGDAGDELFGGYNRYFWSQRIWPKLTRAPISMRRKLAAGILAQSPQRWDRIFEFANYVVPSKFRVRGGGDKLHKLARAMDSRNTDELYRAFVSQWHEPSKVLLGTNEPSFMQDHLGLIPKSLDFVERMMYLDTLTYLPSDILCKVDRASMAVGLEVRVPFLDNEITRLAWSLPVETKIYKGIGKWPLRKVLSRYLPVHLFDRPKMGFGIPIGEWLRGPLRDWADSMLADQVLEADGIFETGAIRQKWREHLSGRWNHQHSLWGVLMFQAWRQKWL